MPFDYRTLPIETPSFVIDRALLRRNMRQLADIQARAECRILLAMKGFATWAFFEEMAPYLGGVAVSSTYEARLARETFTTGEVHAYSPAYTAAEVEELTGLADHIVFNSFRQWNTYRQAIAKADRNIEVALRVNPEYSEVRVEIYNPCTIRSRFGIRISDFDGNNLDGITGLHFHTMCQQGADVLVRTLEQVEELFGEYFGQLKWINFGGGHHITRPGYDIDLLCETICDFRKRTGLRVYLEPGEAHVMNTGFLVTQVLDVIENPHSADIAIVDASAAAHMPDVMEMPYTPEVWHGRVFYDDHFDAPLDEFPHKYLLGGKTCLSGDIIGEYGFENELRVGDRLVLTDMAQYTLVKTTMFNGIRHPSIVSVDSDIPGGDMRVIRQYGYEDYKRRLG
ncbi:MAG: carboxynorspermidine decarboxylase [Planctomycetes bacterium]|nr:carboxynorspermidine decarboxylase [Planctomycetota bacterium]